MRKILLTTRTEFKEKQYNKYFIEKNNTSNLENNMNLGRFLILNINDLDMAMAKEMLTLIYKYRYKIYAYKNCEKHFFFRLVNKFKVIYIDKISDLDEVYNFSNYENIYHIGDIHGCYKALKRFWDENYDDKSLYIFLGDLIDRGSENLDVIRFCLSIRNKMNVIFIEGNHDTNLWHYSQNNYTNLSRCFMNTCKQLVDSDIHKIDISKFMYSMKEHIYYKYLGKKILVSHGGLTGLPREFFLVDSFNFINGQGNDYTEVDKLFMYNTEDRYYQIHGHRNVFKYKSDRYLPSQNLEGAVENGGSLRISKLNKFNGFLFLYYKNE